MEIKSYMNLQSRIQEILMEKVGKVLTLEDVVGLEKEFSAYRTYLMLKSNQVREILDRL